MPLHTNLYLRLEAQQSIAADLLALSTTHKLESLIDLFDGVLADQADLVYSASRTLIPSSNEALHLFNGSLTDVRNVPLRFARVRMLAIAAPATNPNPIQVASDALGGIRGLFALSVEGPSGVVVRPGGVALVASRDAVGAPVVNGADALSIANLGAGASVCRIILIGASA